MSRTVLHVDLNNFYASVECLYEPSLRDKPVAVTGDVEMRHGIVLAKNYEAKKYGVATGNPVWLAKQKCPDLVCVEPHYDRYLKYSKIARSIYAEYTDMVEPFGLDECWLDVTGSVGLFGDGERIADLIRQRIRDELGVTVSVGVSFNKIFAKLGSDMKKPDATTVITEADFRDKVWKLDVSALLFVGRAVCEKLKRYGIRTIGDLAVSDLRLLEYILGKNGVMLHLFANGKDTAPVASVEDEYAIRSVSNSITAHRDLVSDEDIRITLYAICESVSSRLRQKELICRTVQIGIRNTDLKWYSRQTKLAYPNRTSDSLFEAAYALFVRNHRSGEPVRSLSVRATDLCRQEGEQMSLRPEICFIQRHETLEEAVDIIRGMYGHGILQRGIMYTDKLLSSIDPAKEHAIHPDSFMR